MHITYCSACGVRMQIKTTAHDASMKCEDCLAGKPTHPARKGDSAHLRRRSTSRMLKQVKPTES